MDDYYEKLKSKIGIKKHFVLSGHDESNLDGVLHKLRPNSCAENFKHLLTKSQN
jgi:hypothetical protein